MTKLLSRCLLLASIGCCAPAFADDGGRQPQMTKEQAMDACMKKQMQVDAQVPKADMKKHCADTIGKRKESTGPVAGTMDPAKS